MVNVIENTHGTASGTDKPSETSIDWTAFEELQRLRRAAHDSFALNALEHACDRLLEHRHRSSSGKKLAENVYRDARKSTRVQRQQFLPVDNIKDHLPDPALDPCARLTAGESVKHAAELIHNNFIGLPLRVRKAIALKAHRAAPEDIRSALGLGPRQFRNLSRIGLKALGEINGDREEIQSLLLQDSAHLRELEAQLELLIRNPSLHS